MYIYFLSSATSRIYLAFMRTFIVCHVVLNNCWGDGWDPDPWNQDTDPRIRIHIYIYIFFSDPGNIAPQTTYTFCRLYPIWGHLGNAYFLKRNFGENQSVLEFTLSKAWSSQGMMMVSYSKFLHDQPFSTPFPPRKLPFSRYVSRGVQRQRIYVYKHLEEATWELTFPFVAAVCVHKSKPGWIRPKMVISKI